MNNKMKSLSDALTAAGVGISPSYFGSDTVFTHDGYGIFCTLTGHVQARNVYDKDDRFGLGPVSTDAETLAANYVEAMALPWHER